MSLSTHRPAEQQPVFPCPFCCGPAGGGDGTDLEIQPLRVSVAREAWEGLPGSFTPTEQGAGAGEQQEASRR